MEQSVVLLLLMALAGVTFCANKRKETNWKIAGGSKANVAQFPYQVAVFIRRNYICGGSIINPSVVLTAAQCVPKKSNIILSVQLGANNIFSYIHQIDISEIVKHENFKDYPRTNDIALLIAPRNSLKYNEYIGPIVLETEEIRACDCVLTGWGSGRLNEHHSYDLHYINLKCISSQDCKIIIPKSKPFDKNQICTISKRGEGLCMGDAGSPLVANGKQIGIASYILGTDCAQGYPDMYTKVSAYIQWIDEKILEFLPEVTTEEPKYSNNTETVDEIFHTQTPQN